MSAVPRGNTESVDNEPTLEGFLGSPDADNPDSSSRYAFSVPQASHWPGVPFPFDQSPSDTTTSTAQLSFASPSSFENSSLRSTGGYQSWSAGPQTSNVGITSFYRDGFSPSAYTIFSNGGRNLITTSDRGGNLAGFENTLSTLPELDVFQDILASTEWPADTGYQGQRSPPLNPAFTGALPFHHHAGVQIQAPALAFQEAAYTDSPFVPQSTSAAPALADAGSALSTPPSQLQQRRTPTSRTSQQRGERLNCTQPNCTATFGRGAEFRRHMRTVHQQQRNPSYRCLVESCDYQYERADKVRSHMEKVHKLRLERI